MSDKDWDIIHRQLSDNSSEAEFYSEAFSYLRRIIKNRVNKIEDAEDITLGAAVRFVEKCNSFDNFNDFVEEIIDWRALASTIANLEIMEHRRKIYDKMNISMDIEAEQRLSEALLGAKVLSEALLLSEAVEKFPLVTGELEDLQATRVLSNFSLPIESATESQQKHTSVRAMRDYLKSKGLLERKQSAASKQLNMINQQLVSGQGNVEELLELATSAAKQHIKNAS